MVNEISNGLSNGKQSEAMESDAGVRVGVGMCEAESGGMHITVCHLLYCALILALVFSTLVLSLCWTCLCI